MTGYKAFDENLQCRGFQFEVGKTYETGKQKWVDYKVWKPADDSIFRRAF